MIGFGLATARALDHADERRLRALALGDPGAEDLAVGRKHLLGDAYRCGDVRRRARAPRGLEGVDLRELLLGLGLARLGNRLRGRIRERPLAGLREGVSELLDGVDEPYARSGAGRLCSDEDLPFELAVDLDRRRVRVFGRVPGGVLGRVVARDDGEREAAHVLREVDEPRSVEGRRFVGSLRARLHGAIASVHS